MALSKRRLVKLESRFGVGTGQFTPHRGELERESVTAEAVQRLTTVELTVLEEMMELHEQHSNLSGAGFFQMMTDVHHALEHEWTKVVRGVLRDRIEESDETRERKAELQKRADEAVRMGMLPLELGR